MAAYLMEWLDLAIRWAHVIVGIAWIGSSFYFVWLDTRLNKPPVNPESPLVAGDLWAVHGGGFYHAQKYQVAPERLPDHLHWFKWEAYSTWITGFLLMSALYYARPDVYLVDKSVLAMSSAIAVAVSVALLAVGWIVYDGICRLLRTDSAITVVGAAFLTGLIWLCTHVFGGRGAFLQVGATVGTIMVANVFFVIIPAQKLMVAAMRRGEQPDPLPGLRARQRSLHNNYLTLPVVFVMISNHYAVTWGRDLNWLVLVVVFAAGMLIRHYFNLRNRGHHAPALPVAAVILLGALAWLLAPRAEPRGAVSFDQVRSVIKDRCVACHAEHPTNPVAPVAPKGVRFDSDAQITAWADRIYERCVISRSMPLGNLTHMTDAERRLVGDWYLARK